MSPSDPLTLLLIRAISVVLSTAIILACIRAFIFFGGAIEAQRNLTDAHKGLAQAVRDAGDKFDRFAGEVRDGLASHSERIAVAETNQADHDRRLGDLERRRHKRRAADPDELDD